MALTFFTLGVVGILGSDDILCCFVVGNSFTWDDWFRVQSEDHSFQDVIDQLLNSVSVVFECLGVGGHSFVSLTGTGNILIHRSYIALGTFQRLL